MPVTSRRRAWIERNRPLVFVLRAVPVPVLRGFYMRQRNVSFRKLVVQQHSPRGIGRRPCPDFRRRQNAIMRKERIGVGQSRIRRRVLGILTDRLLKKFESLSESCIRPLAAMVAALKIKVVCSQALGPLSATALVGHQVGLYLFRHCASDFLLYTKNVTDV